MPKNVWWSAGNQPSALAEKRKEMKLTNTTRGALLTGRSLVHAGATFVLTKLNLFNSMKIISTLLTVLAVAAATQAKEIKLLNVSYDPTRELCLSATARGAVGSCELKEIPGLPGYIAHKLTLILSSPSLGYRSCDCLNEANMLCARSSIWAWHGSWAVHCCRFPNWRRRTICPSSFWKPSWSS